MTTFNNFIHKKDQKAIRSLLNGKDYKEIANDCGVSFSTVNNLVNGHTRLGKRNFNVYTNLVNRALMEIEEMELLYKNHLNNILK